MQSQFVDENIRQHVKKFWKKHSSLPELNFLDIETTGLSPMVHEILEIGIIKVDREGNISYFEQLVKPRGLISEENERIHGIHAELVKDAPYIEDIFSSCLHFLTDTPVVGHNIQFDCGFLLTQAIMQKKTLQSNDIFDTCLFSRQVAKKTKRHPLNHKLSTLKQLYLPHANNLISHRALADSVSCLQVFMHLVELLADVEDVCSLFFEKSFLYKFQHELKREDFEVSFKGMCDFERDILFSSLEKNTPIAISYAGGSHGLDLRPIRPIALLPTQRHLILHAECLLTHQMRNFKLKLIEKIVPSGYTHA